MSVYSMREILENSTEEYLRQVVPDDVEFIYDLSMMMWPTICDECEEEHYSPMVRFGCWVKYPPCERDNKPPYQPVMSAAACVEVNMVEDGDFEPLKEAIDSLWEKIEFRALVVDSVEDMENLARDLESEG